MNATVLASQTTTHHTRSQVVPQKDVVRQIKNSAPIFIIGSHRSGTSFLYRLIQKHLNIGFGRDNGNFIHFLNLLPHYGDLSNYDNMFQLVSDILAIPEFKKRFSGLEIDPDTFIENLDAPTYPEVVRQFYAEWAYLKGADRWGGKTPDYSLHVNSLHQLFPDAKFIHIIRDGRDVALSLFNLDWGPKDALLAAQHWQERVSAALNFGKELGKENYLELRYEALVQQPEIAFQRLIHFIDFDGDQDLIYEDFLQMTCPKVKRDNYDKWRSRMPAKDIQDFELMAGELLDRLGYPLQYPHLLEKHVTKSQLLLHHIKNVIRKILRGQGFIGFYRKTRQWLRDLRIRISH